MTTRGGRETDLSRRRFLQASAASGAALAFAPTRKLFAPNPAAGATPPGFPANIKLYKQVYENWSLDVHVADVWTAQATSYADALRVANWAATNGWRVRPSGMHHNWAPYNVTPTQTPDTKLVLVDMTALDAIVVDKPTKTVWAQAGALMDNVMLHLEQNGLGFSSIPAPGSITIAGALAINGHGAAVPARGENTTGRSYGSLSNRVVSLKALVWDASSGAFRITSIDRSDPRAKAMLTGLGRVFILSALLRAEQNVHLRCVSRTDITTDELFAAPGHTNGKRTFARFVEETGRVEAIIYPFSPRPWLKTWAVAPTKPAASRAVAAGYNYPFSDNIPLAVSKLAKLAVTSDPPSAVELGVLSQRLTDVGLVATNSADIWGPARTSQHYIRATTLRATALSHAIVTSRADIQRATHEYVTKYHQLVNAYRGRGLYPVNMPVEIRCTGVDDPAYVGVAGAEAPSLSSTSPRPDKPEWDTVIFMSTLALVGTKGLFPFMREFEQWMIGNYSGDYAMVRAEWSKAWAVSPNASWADPHVLNTVIPNTYRAGRRADANWDWAIRTFNELDPKHVFGNEFTDKLLR